MEPRMFVQTLVLLLKSAPTLDEIQAVLKKHPVTARMEDGVDSWEICGPSVVMDYREEDGGKYVVDVVNRPWPDDLDYDNPESPLHQAWLAGHFGAYLLPESLERAKEQCWRWPEGKEAVEEATAFLRLRTTFLLDSQTEPNEDNWIPVDFDPAAELEELHKVIAELLELPQVICYFNPQGEVLRDKELFLETDKICQENEIPPLDLWSNVRLYRIDDDWVLMDTVGNCQLETMDVEACFLGDAYDMNDVDQLLRLVTMYLLEDPEFEDSESVEDENGVTWKISIELDSLCDPPREVVRLIPDDGNIPPDLSSESDDADEDDEDE